MRKRRILSLLLSFALALTTTVGSFTSNADSSGDGSAYNGEALPEDITGTDAPDEEAQPAEETAPEEGEESPEDVYGEPAEELPEDDDSEGNEHDGESPDYIYIDGIRVPIGGDADIVVKEVSDEETARIIANQADVPENDEKTDETDGVVSGYNYSSSYLLNNEFLTSDEKRIYNAMDNACRNVLSSTADYTEEVNYTDGTSEKLIARISFSGVTRDRALIIARLFRFSNPQYYFLSHAFGSNSTNQIVFLQFLSTFGYDYSKYSYRKTAQKELDDLTEAWMADIDNKVGDLAKELEISNKVIAYLEYDDPAVDDTNPNAEANNIFDQSLISGVLRETTICAGYAMMTAYFCNAAGLDCFYVNGPGHAWNLVKLYDNWYEIDNTWADQSTWINTKWINKKHSTFVSQDSEYHVYRDIWNGINLPQTYYDEVQVPTIAVDQYNFPDTNFRQYVASMIDDGDGKLTETECTAVAYMNVKGRSISDLTGVGYFTELTELNCQSNALTSLDLSGNKKLTYLYCNDNKLASLNVEKNTALEFLACHNNKLTGLNISNNTSLTDLYCYNNQIKALNLNNNTALVRLSCFGNKLTSLVLSKNTALTDLSCGNNQLISLDLSRNRFVTSFYCEGNSFDIGTVTGTYPLSKLSGFNSSRASGWNNVSYDADSDSLWNFTRNSVSYTYDCGNGLTAVFGLTLTREKVASPKATATAGNGQITLSWEAVTGADKYCVNLYNSNNKKYSSVKSDVTDTSYVVTGLTNDTNYTFLVQACVNGLWSSFTTDDHVDATPYNSVPKVTAIPGNGSVTLTWDAIPGASKYAINRVEDGKYRLVNGKYTGTSITIDGLENDVTYTYLVQSYLNGAWSTFTENDYVSVTPFDPVPKVTALAGDGMVILSWNEIPGAEKYAINRYIPSTRKYKLVNANYTGTTITIDGLENGETYTYLVQAYVNGGWNDFTEDNYVSATPYDTTPKVTAVPGNGYAILQWDAIPNASKYAINRVVNGKYSLVNKNCTETSIRIDNLTNGVTYTYLVQSYVNDLWSDFSETDYVSVTPVNNVPKVTAIPDDGSVTLTWKAIPGASKYAINRVEDGKYRLVNGKYTGTSITIDGLENGVTYTFLVQSYLNGAWSTFTENDYVSVTPFDPVPKVTALAGDGMIILRWNEVFGAEKYAINRYIPSTRKYKLVTANCTGTTITIDGLENGETYTYLVQAYVNGGWNDFSDENYVSATPYDTTPKVTAVPGNGYAILQWDAIPNASKYAINRVVNGKYSRVNINCTETSIRIDNLTNGVTYTYLVQACVNDMWSDFSETDYVSVTPVNNVPKVTATPGVGAVTLTWDAIPGASKYAINRVEDGKYRLVNGKYTGTSITIDGLENGVTYTFLVQSYLNGAWSPFTENDYVSVTPFDPVPKVTALAGDGMITLSWNEVPGAEKYAINRYIPSTRKYKLVNANYTGTSMTIDGLENGVTYTYIVQAFVNGAWNDFTEENFVSATPNVSGPKASAVPGDGKATLTWAAVSGAEKYVVSKYENGKYTPVKTTVTGTSVVFSGLTNGKTYTYVVQAYVNGAWTTYTAADHVNVTPNVGSPKTTAIAGDGNITLSWNLVTGAKKYAVSRYENGKYSAVYLSLNTTTVIVSGLTNGKKYTYLVQAYVNGKWSTYTTADHVSATPNVSSPIPVATVGDGTITLTWAAVNGASKYAVTRYENGKYSSVKSALTATTLTITGLTNGTPYTYLVQAYVNNAWTTYTVGHHVTATPEKPANPIVSAKVYKDTATTEGGKNGIKLWWNSVPQAANYRVFVSESPITSADTSLYVVQTGAVLEYWLESFNNKLLKQGSTYYFFVQAYVDGQWLAFESDKVIQKKYG